MGGGEGNQGEASGATIVSRQQGLFFLFFIWSPFFVFLGPMESLESPDHETRASGARAHWGRFGRDGFG